ncbi:MAG: hypothetical protein WD063_13415 [Pirellulales bacterium]
MTEQDDAKRRRAKRIHAQIEALVEPKKSDSDTEQRRAPPKSRPTPREFIHRKMRERDEQKPDKKT